VRVCAVGGDGVRERPDKVVTEEPMEIRLHGPGQDPEALAITMRTPGHDFELAVGFCLTEGLLRSADELDTVAYCLAGTGEQEFNVVTVKLRRPVERRDGARMVVANASCGLCGKTTLDELEQECPELADGPLVPVSVVAALPEHLRRAQSVFEATGGLHAAARFTAGGELLAVREDVGRHNALDKLVGHALLERALPLGDDVLMVSGRVSFEIVQKAAMAGIPVVCAVSAPSSLAVEAARRLGQTLVGFVRDGNANIYTHPRRLDVEH
jgi:FdhD protein